MYMDIYSIHHVVTIICGHIINTNIKVQSIPREYKLTIECTYISMFYTYMYGSLAFLSIIIISSVFNDIYLPIYIHTYVHTYIYTYKRHIYIHTYL